MSSARRTIRTMCPMNCHPTLCGMLVDVEDGHLVGVKGDPENPDSQGFLCIRGQASQEIIGNPKRVLFPLVRDRRTDDAWRRASWDEALDLVVARMQTAGPPVQSRISYSAATSGLPGSCQSLRTRTAIAS